MTQVNPGWTADRRAQTITVGGELDLHTVPALRVAIDACVASGTHPVVLDLTDVSFLDSTAIMLVMQTHDKLNRAGRPLLLVSTSPQVLRIFEMTGLSDAMALHPTVLAATDSLNDASSA